MSRQTEASWSQVAILANTANQARAYARRRFPGRSTLALIQAADLYLLYGKSQIPLDVVPGTDIQWWHDDIAKHVAMGRVCWVREPRRREPDVLPPGSYNATVMDTEDGRVLVINDGTYAGTIVRMGYTRMMQDFEDEQTPEQDNENASD